MHVKSQPWTHRTVKRQGGQTLTHPRILEARNIASPPLLSPCSSNLAYTAVCLMLKLVLLQLCIYLEAKCM